MENKDWTDILYILIAVVFGIIGKLAQRKSKTVAKKPVVEHEVEHWEEEVPEKPEKPQVSKAEAIFDTFYESILGEDISEPVKKYEDEDYEPSELKEEKVIKQPEHENDRLAELLKKVSEEERENELAGGKIEFDLREAVVYSEILNRKYN